MGEREREREREYVRVSESDGEEMGQGQKEAGREGQLLTVDGGTIKDDFVGRSGHVLKLQQLLSIYMKLQKGFF